MIIGITGTFCAGKGAVVDYLVKTRNFVHYSARRFLTEEVIRRGLPENRDTMTIVADDFRKKYSPGYIVEQFLKKAEGEKRNIVIESLRSPGEVTKLHTVPGAILLAIDADRKIRYKRAQMRKSSTDNVSFEKFVANEEMESSSTEAWQMNLIRCREMADYVLENNGSKEELHQQIEKILKKLEK